MHVRTQSIYTHRSITELPSRRLIRRPAAGFIPGAGGVAGGGGRRKRRPAAEEEAGVVVAAVVAVAVGLGLVTDGGG